MDRRAIVVVEPRASTVPISSVPPTAEGNEWSMVALKNPDTIEFADEYPVIVWGDYTYWPFSYKDNRNSMCLLAFDSLNNLVKTWEVSGARYIVSLTVDPSRHEITLLGQASNTVTLSWNAIGDVTPMNPQYFWIINQASQMALALASHPNVHLLPIANDDAQLWLLDPSREAIFPKTNPNMCLDYVQPPNLNPNPNEKIPIRLAKTNWSNTQQRWIIEASTGYLKPVATTTPLVATWSSSDNSVFLQGASSSNQTWYLKPYIPSPDLSTTQFSLVINPEQSPFQLTNQGHVLISAGADTPLMFLPNTDTNTDTNKSAQWLYRAGGMLVNVQTGLAMTASGSLSVIGSSPVTGRPEQQWSLTTDGYLVCKANGLLMMAHDNNVILTRYDPLRPADQEWFLKLIEPTSSQVHLLTRASKNITELAVTAEISNDWWAGTVDTIYIGFGGNRYQTLFENPSRGDTVTVTIDLSYMFGMSAINLFNDLTTLQIWQKPFPHPIANDYWKLKSIILKAKDSSTDAKFTNYQFRRVDKWLYNRRSWPFLDLVWSSLIPWGSWVNSDTKPIDANGRTYLVGMIPYIGDILSWRTYDPSTIDGVGQILGVRNGRIVGELLKYPPKTELLEPTDERHSYTWVFTPSGAIIYRRWDKQDRADYIRHSQLGSGQPVICAGEMQIQRILDKYTLTDVIALVNDASGHYRPDGGACLESVGHKLEELGIPTSNIQWYFRNPLQ